MKIIDLHTHSSFSDGTFTPAELVLLAKENGLSAIALTDHDTANGIDEALLEGVKSGVEVIAGIELVAEYGNEEIHVLGYFIEHKGQYFINALNSFMQLRADRNERLLARLRSLGMNVDEKLLRKNGETLTRLHFANALAVAGYVKSPADAFARYLDPGCPAFVGRNAPGYEEVIDTIRRSGGIAVAAHPYLYKWAGGEVSQMLEKLCAAGLGGVEAYYPSHTPKQTAALLKAAGKLGLTVTGGSDFHGENRQVPLGAGNIGYEVLEELRKAHEKNSFV